MINYISLIPIILVSTPLLHNPSAECRQSWIIYTLLLWLWNSHIYELKIFCPRLKINIFSVLLDSISVPVRQPETFPWRLDNCPSARRDLPAPIGPPEAIEKVEWTFSIQFSWSIIYLSQTFLGKSSLWKLKKKKSFCKLWNVAHTTLLRRRLVSPGQEFWKVLSASSRFVCSVHWPSWLGIRSCTKGAFLEWRGISKRPAEQVMVMKPVAKAAGGACNTHVLWVGSLGALGLGGPARGASWWGLYLSGPRCLRLWGWGARWDTAPHIPSGSGFPSWFRKHIDPIPWNPELGTD